MDVILLVKCSLMVIPNSFNSPLYSIYESLVKQQSKVWLILIALWIINGSSFLAIKISIDTIPPLLSAAIRFTIAGSILLTAYLIRKEYEHKSEHIGKQQWKDTIVLAVALFLGGQGLLTWGSQFLSSGMTGLLNSTIPLWVAIIAFALYRRKMSKLTVIGLAAGFGGLMLLIAPSLGSGTLDPTGLSALLLSSIAWAFGSIYSAKAKLPVSILASSGMLMISGGLILMAASFILGEFRGLDISQISRNSLIAMVYLIVVITVIGFTDFYWLLRVTTASLANTFAYVSPVIAVILGWAILHETITLIMIIAMAVILLGVALMVTKPKDRKKPIPTKAE
jgi:drug/metabolite transporter (DMT)-like permease